jgi:hypothetical protein
MSRMGIGAGVKYTTEDVVSLNTLWCYWLKQ